MVFLHAKYSVSSCTIASLRLRREAFLRHGARWPVMIIMRPTVLWLGRCATSVSKFTWDVCTGSLCAVVMSDSLFVILTSWCLVRPTTSATGRLTKRVCMMRLRVFPPNACYGWLCGCTLLRAYVGRQNSTLSLDQAEQL